MAENMTVWPQRCPGRVRNGCNKMSHASFLKERKVSYEAPEHSSSVPALALAADI
jgi:hypothetical protein